MTVYTQHPNRGKVQILAAYRAPAGLTSTTVTSVESAEAAAPIVDALNRLSAAATAPLSAWDERDEEEVETYPVEHLEALLAPEGRRLLLTGEHSLWYEYTKVLIHQAMSDLDAAIASLPATVRTAVAAEVETEGRQLAAEWRRFTTNEQPAEEGRRVWGFDVPTILFGAAEFTTITKGRLDRTELALSETSVEQAVADLRLLSEAHYRCGNRAVELNPGSLSISYDPGDDERYFVSVAAPFPFRHRQYGWHIELYRWVPDPEDEFDDTETGNLVLTCRMAEAPSAAEINALLELCGAQPELLPLWAKTPHGEPLMGTSFVVTG